MKNKFSNRIIEMKRTKSTIYLTRGALIAALYVALTFVSSLMGLSSGPIQLRLSEALTILPVIFPEAIPGLFIGCLIANLLTGAVIWDVIFGSLATLIGAAGAYFLRKLPRKLIWLATLPTVLSNALIVPLVIIFAYGAADAYGFLFLTVGLGELLSAGVLGTLLYRLLIRTRAL